MGDSVVRELHELDEFREVERLYDEIWPHAAGHGRVLTVELMRALDHAGNYVAGAYRDGRLVGASVAFFGAPIGETLHSHATGAVAGSGVGFALKRHQREWALARGLRRITWTFDPLVRRNAYFNLVKLGARPEQYLPNFYGDDMVDTVNGGDRSDRVLAVWRLHDPLVRAAVGEAEPAERGADSGVRAEAALVERDGRPVSVRTDAEVVRVAVPADIEAMRRTDPEAAGAWRSALREVLGGLLDAGARVLDFDREAGYLVARRL
ncbi:GNAT family N-acetyltransferase [Embleya scabrispora]|uniref:GNAT family N-acetyltransferase n=1 Tax=Embleya scabrispora TaxID=159449 RepID=A0A1T3NUG6_9ACTN|nr:GNAT family N-acetyltransferase [Embleya scabrispora]OPC80281.1 GNAT family N-acetyltransferase [Embleya scabrispora]